MLVSRLNPILEDTLASPMAPVLKDDKDAIVILITALESEHL